MKSLFSLSLRYLKAQKKRTIATALGIIMSVALVTGTGLLVNSYQDMSLRAEIARNGSWHFKLNGDMTPQTITKLNDNYLIQTAGIAAFDKALDMGEKKDAYASYQGVVGHEVLYLRELDARCLPMMPYTIVEGRMPETAEEIVLHTSAVHWEGRELKIGDKISQPLCRIEEMEAETADSYTCQTRLVPESVREFTIVGVYSSPSYYSEVEGEALTVNPSGTHDYFAYVQVKPGIDYWKAMDNALKDCGLTDLDVTGGGVLSYMGQGKSTISDSLRTTLITLALIIMSVMVIVISNSFSMSMSEKVSQIGTLRCIGATPAQVRSIVMGEALMTWAMALPLGLLSGLGAMAVVFQVVSALAMDASSQLRLVPSPFPFVLSAAVSLLAVLFSAYLPARKANRISMVEAVKGMDAGQDARIRKNRKGRLWGKLFGFPGFLAAKNIRRNPRRFRVTVMSVVVSVAMFISLGGFAGSLSNTVLAANAMFEKDFEYYNYAQNESEQEDLQKAFRRLKAEADRIDGVERTQFYSSMAADMLISSENINEQYHEKAEQFSEFFQDYTLVREGVFSKSIGISPIDRGNYNELRFISSAPTYDDLLSSGEILLMQRASAMTDGGRILSEDFANYQAGAEIELKFYHYGEEETRNARIGGLLEECPWYLAGDQVSGCILLPEEIYWQWHDAYGDIGDGYCLALQMQEGREEQTQDALTELADGYPNIHCVSQYQQTVESKNLFLIMNIFIYGFMMVIILICCVSVFNTINTNLLMRRKETAMIRAVGMDRGQLIKTLLLECALYGVTGTFWGSLIGLPLLSFLSRSFGVIMTASLRSPLAYITMALVASVTISILAGIGPIRKIIKTPIIDQIRAQS